MIKYTSGYISELPVLLKASPLLHIEVTSIDHDKVTLEEPFRVEIRIVNQSPVDLSCDSVWLTQADYTPSSAKLKRLDSVKSPVSRQSSDTLLDRRIVMNKKPVKKRIPSTIGLQAHFEMSQSSVASAGIACVNTNEILKRNDSTQSDMGVGEDNVIKDTVSPYVSLNNIVLKQGENIVHFACQVIQIIIALKALLHTVNSHVLIDTNPCINKTVHILLIHGFEVLHISSPGLSQNMMPSSVTCTCTVGN